MYTIQNSNFLDHPIDPTGSSLALQRDPRDILKQLEAEAMVLRLLHSKIADQLRRLQVEAVAFRQDVEREQKSAPVPEHNSPQTIEPESTDKVPNPPQPLKKTLEPTPSIGAPILPAVPSAPPKAPIQKPLPKVSKPLHQQVPIPPVDTKVLYENEDDNNDEDEDEDENMDDVEEAASKEMRKILKREYGKDYEDYDEGSSDDDDPFY